MAKKKVIFNLLPDNKSADRFAITYTSTVGGLKGDVYRECFLAGVLLHQLDPRLPAILTEALDEQSDVDTLMNSLRLLKITTTAESTTKPEKTAKGVGNAKSLFLGDE
jgi:hypothetical protein